MKPFAPLFLLLSGLILPVMLRGQAADSLSSIVGQTYQRMEIAVPGQVDRTQILDLPLSGIKVVLVAGRDTLRATTDERGKFTFTGLGTRQVTLSMVDDAYAPFSESFTLMPGENLVIVPRQRKAETLDEASVAAERPVMTMRGDTLVYHASALTVNEGDYAIDLLRQMPGVEVDRTTGEIRISGKSVARSYVNGALIFGLTPMDAMQNLRAEQVVTMEVYDETDPEEIIDRRAREKQRVVNIKTKDPIFSTTDLQFRAIAGADETRQDDGRPQYRYAAGTNAHFFSELVQLSADVVTNNVGMGSSNINAVPGPQTNYRATTDLDLGFYRYWESPLYGNGLNTRYTYSHSRLASRSRRLQEYFELPQSPAHTVEEASSSSQRTEVHRIQADFAIRTWDLAVVTVRQSFNLSRSLSDRLTAGSTVYGSMSPMRREETSSTGNRSWGLSETVNVRFKPGKNGRPGPNLSFGVMLRKNGLDAWNLDTLASSYTKRFLTKEGSELQQMWMGDLSQILYEYRKNGRQLQVTGEYTMTYNLQTRVQEAYDLYGVDAPAVNMANTFDFTDSNLTQDFSLSSRFSGNPVFSPVTLNLGLRSTRIKDRERLPAPLSADKTYLSFMPAMSVTILRRLNVRVASNTKYPSVEQLRRRIDDTNPLSLVAGNPDLKQSQSWALQLNGASDRTRARKWTTTWGANATYESRPLVQRTLFYREAAVLDDYDGYRVPAGASVLRTDNADFALTASVSLNSSARLSLLGGRLKPTVTVQPKLDYRLQPQYFGEVLDRLSEWTPAMNLTVNAPLWRGAQASLKGDVAYIRATSQAGNMDRRAVRGQLDVNMSTDFLRYGFFTGDYSWRPVRDLTEPTRNRDLHQLNLALGVNLLQKDLKICLRGVDLLRSGTVYSITMGPSSVTHSWTPVYGRYFVLDISYRFNNSGGRAMPRYGL